MNGQLVPILRCEAGTGAVRLTATSTPANDQTLSPPRHFWASRLLCSSFGQSVKKTSQKVGLVYGFFTDAEAVKERSIATSPEKFTLVEQYVAVDALLRAGESYNVPRPLRWPLPRAFH